MKPRIEKYEDLVCFLQSWTSWSGDGYDIAGMMAILAACLDNLQTNALEADLDELREYLTVEQASFLRKLSEYVLPEN